MNISHQQKSVSSSKIPSSSSPSSNVSISGGKLHTSETLLKSALSATTTEQEQASIPLVEVVEETDAKQNMENKKYGRE